MASDRAVALSFAMMQAAELRHRVESEEGEEQALAIYGEVLHRVDDDVLREATTRHISGSKWWATPSELLDLCRGISHERSRVPLLSIDGCLPVEEARAALRRIAEGMRGGSLMVEVPDGESPHADARDAGHRPDSGAPPAGVGGGGPRPAGQGEGPGLRRPQHDHLQARSGTRSARPRRDVD